MSADIARVSVRILDKEYQIACPQSERADLMRCAELLNNRMREIRDSGKVVGLDRIAVMAALNLANELLQTRAKDEAIENSLGPRLKVLNERVASVLGNQQLEL